MVFLTVGATSGLGNPIIRRRGVGTPRLRVRVSRYRLGALGCLDLSSLSATADHQHLRDLVLALRWSGSIAEFGW